MKTYQISESLLNQIAAYLQGRPYREVVGLLNGLQAEADNQQTHVPEKTDGNE